MESPERSEASSARFPHPKNAYPTRAAVSRPQSNPEAAIGGIEIVNRPHGGDDDPVIETIAVVNRSGTTHITPVVTRTSTPLQPSQLVVETGEPARGNSNMVYAAETDALASGGKSTAAEAESPRKQRSSMIDTVSEENRSLRAVAVEQQRHLGSTDDGSEVTSISHSRNSPSTATAATEKGVTGKSGGDRSNGDSDSDGMSKVHERFPSRVGKEGAGMDEAGMAAGGSDDGSKHGGDRVRLLVGSFNVGNSPLQDLAPWLPHGGKGFDLIVVGLQESTYRAPRGGRESPLAHCNSLSPIASPVRTTSGASMRGVSPRWAAMQIHAAEMGDDTPPPGQGFSLPPTSPPFESLPSPQPKPGFLTPQPSPSKAQDFLCRRIFLPASEYCSPSIHGRAESSRSPSFAQPHFGKPSTDFERSGGNADKPRSCADGKFDSSSGKSGSSNLEGKASSSAALGSSSSTTVLPASSTFLPSKRSAVGRRHSDTAGPMNRGSAFPGIGSVRTNVTVESPRPPWAMPEAREGRGCGQRAVSDQGGGIEAGNGQDRNAIMRRSVTESGKKALHDHSVGSSMDGMMSPSWGTPTISPPKPGGVRSSPPQSTSGTPPQPGAGLSHSLPSALPSDLEEWELRSGAEHSNDHMSRDWASTAPNSFPVLNKDLTRFGRARKAVKKRTKELDAGAAHLRSMLHGHLGPDFEQVISLRRMQMRVKVFLRRSLLSVYDHEEGESTAENTGIGKVVANKGGLVCKLRLKGTTLCFVSCHLQAHEGQNHLARRNSSCAEILQGARLGDRRKIDVDSQFHHVFWFGDMNYRISFGLAADEQHSHVTGLVKERNWPELWEGDELLRELEAGRVLTGFQTEPPAFAPTFKTVRGQEDGYSAKRVPSYTDRILWKSLPGHAPNLDLLRFASFPEITSSDHKPIHAAFSVRLTPEVKAPPLPERRQGRRRGRMPAVLDVPRLHLHPQPMARLVFEELQATDLVEIAGGGVRNPFVVFSSDPKHLLGLSGKPMKTGVKRRTLNPRWMKKYVCQLTVSEPSLLEHSHVSLLVWDQEAVVGSKSDLIGVANLSVAQVMRNSYPHKQRPPQPAPSPTGLSLSRRRSIQNFLLHPTRRRSLSPQSVQTLRTAQSVNCGRGTSSSVGGVGASGVIGAGVASNASGQRSKSAAVSTTGARARAATTGEYGKSDDGKTNYGRRASSNSCSDIKEYGEEENAGREQDGGGSALGAAGMVSTDEPERDDRGKTGASSLASPRVLLSRHKSHGSFSAPWRFLRRGPSLSSESTTWGPAGGPPVAGDSGAGPCSTVSDNGKGGGGGGDDIERLRPGLPLHHYHHPHSHPHFIRRHSFKDGMEFNLPLVKCGLVRGRIKGRCVFVTDFGGGGGGGGAGIGGVHGFRGHIGGDSVAERANSFGRAVVDKAKEKKGKVKRRFFRGRRKAGGATQDPGDIIDNSVNGGGDEGVGGVGNGDGEEKQNIGLQSSREVASLADWEHGVSSERTPRLEYDTKRRRRKNLTGSGATDGSCVCM